MSENFNSTDAAKLSLFFASIAFSIYLFYKIVWEVEHFIVIILNPLFLIPFLCMSAATLFFLIMYIVKKTKENNIKNANHNKQKL